MNFLYIGRSLLFFFFTVWNKIIIFLFSNEEKQYKYFFYPKEFNKKYCIDISDSFIGYIPWIKGHTENLVAAISDRVAYKICPVFLFNLSEPMSRAKINKFVRSNQVPYRVFIRRIFNNDKLQGMIFTFDWMPTMQIIVDECNSLNICTILIPHEGVFLDENKYYWDEKSGISCPSCNYVLGWGNLQKRIFCKRGYPEDNFFIVGSPKLDECINFLPICTKQEFFLRYNFQDTKPVILFASQFLDIQIDIHFAQLKQNEIISDLINFCEKNDCQLLLRMPPNGVDILNEENKIKLKSSSALFVDNSENYLSSVKDSIFYSSIVVSINSTMLFESVLMKKKTLAVHYFSVEPIWGKMLVPSVHNKEELNSMLSFLLKADYEYDKKSLSYAAELFSVGSFDGLSAQRIGDMINSFIK